MILILSILASIVIWSFLVSWKYALIIIGSIFIHEYGHFYWMGREGIKEKSMFFVPPFGAVAQSKEMWPSRVAELRIALAGPAFGLISILVFLVSWLLSRNSLFAASIVLASYINLFNLLLPVAILDGGRVIKSILFSINASLGKAFYVLGFMTLGFMVLYSVNFIFVFLVGLILWQEYSFYISTEIRLKKIDAALRLVEESPDPEDTSHATELRDFKARLESLLYLKPMSWLEISYGIAMYAVIVLLYILTIIYIKDFINPNLYTLPDYFR